MPIEFPVRNVWLQERGYFNIVFLPAAQQKRMEHNLIAKSYYVAMNILFSIDWVVAHYFLLVASLLFPINPELCTSIQSQHIPNH